MKILFVTTSLGTKWESYSQALVALGYPSQKRLVIDGTREWHPLMFLEPALREDSDYIVHIDEDCFLFDPTQLNTVISSLEADDDAVLAGLPDGGHYYRNHNPCACNLFFVVMKTRSVREMLASDPEWRRRKFSEEYIRHADPSSLEGGGVRFDDYEPYYPFFWMILARGKKIKYLNSRLDPKVYSTDLYFRDRGTTMARHMWYLRTWHSAELGPYDKVPNLQRYAALEKELLARFGAAPGFKRILLAENVKRLLGKFRRLAARRVSNLIGVRSGPMLGGV